MHLLTLCLEVTQVTTPATPLPRSVVGEGVEVGVVVVNVTEQDKVTELVHQHLVVEFVTLGSDAVGCGPLRVVPQIPALRVLRFLGDDDVVERGGLPSEEAIGRSLHLGVSL